MFQLCPDIRAIDSYQQRTSIFIDIRWYDTGIAGHFSIKGSGDWLMTQSPPENLQAKTWITRFALPIAFGFPSTLRFEVDQREKFNRWWWRTHRRARWPRSLFGKQVVVLVGSARQHGTDAATATVAGA